MKKITAKPLLALAHKVQLTKSRECNCAQLLAMLPELVEASNATDVSPRLQAGRHHLHICDECREEFTVLSRAMDSD